MGIPNSRDTAGKRILVGGTGSIAVTRLPSYIEAMRRQIGGSTFTVLLTHTAASFLPPESAALFAERVVCGESPADWPADKPSRLAGEHDVLAVLPATAHTLAGAAGGAAPNRLLTVALSMDCPVVYFPVMGARMWHKPAVQRNIARIREDGGLVNEPEWHDGFDPATGTVSHHPALPSPEAVAGVIEDLLAKQR
ncbi:flavoprotein [Streptomyces sp. ICN441]|uniref:Flavoprotein n=1 Tax=Streptomyces tirandamycinicus TaxID=2174846 RepID=A0A2S1SUA3_9ACTN|nr:MULTISPECIES: flavoprotein [Streptomyces]AWI29966.1 flavoprotein [Streptomyces tirandamycinicus]MCY0985302.1 flavoprotein [Streptomyces tirandamycinicus]TFE47411.1 flavoprotein [Streptomyces sp. ICN441]